MRWIFLILLFAFPVCAGCGQPDRKGGGFGVGAKLAPGAPGDMPRDEAAREGLAAAQAPGDAGPKGVNAPEKKAKVEKQRKIRQTADMKLIVEDFSKAVKELKAAIAAHKAEEATSEINTSANTVRAGKWIVRVPVAQFDEFRDAVAKIGDVEKHTVDSEDMTDKYYDLQAHIENRKVSREAMRRLLDKVGDRDVAQHMQVSDKLDAITDEINRKEGQLKLWENLTDRTTCTVHMREKQLYTPAAKVEDKEIPTFGMRVSKTWDGSLDLFVGFWQWVAIVAIALAPWLPIPIVFIFCAWLALRLLVRRATKSPPVVLEVVEEKKD